MPSALLARFRGGTLVFMRGGAGLFVSGLCCLSVSIAGEETVDKGLAVLFGVSRSFSGVEFLAGVVGVVCEMDMGSRSML